MPSFLAAAARFSACQEEAANKNSIRRFITRLLPKHLGWNGGLDALLLQPLVVGDGAVLGVRHHLRQRAAGDALMLVLGL